MYLKDEGNTLAKTTPRLEGGELFTATKHKKEKGNKDLLQVLKIWAIIFPSLNDAI